MAVPDSVDPTAWPAEQIDHGNPDPLRSMVKAMAETPVSAEADGLCGAEYGRRSDERTNSRNGYRTRDWDTHAGTVELAIAKLRSVSYFPDWLLERRRLDRRAAAGGGPQARRPRPWGPGEGIGHATGTEAEEGRMKIGAQVTTACLTWVFVRPRGSGA
ncbi:Transposase, Mutator family [Streptosporangium canum]|uniref:Mutator family transposase n=1 Tax=Streptosporangium canum TaxID=324952 RepID=A0A1I3RLJ3_9ACTN|nr:Transposase, Mutator family [Streptosporangium canum]